MPDIEGYDVIEEIGRGGMGTVYRAVQAGAGMPVAIKVIENGEPANEIGSLVRLRHPNIVRIYDGSGVGHYPAYFAMELIENGTLAEARWQEHFREPRRAMELVATLAEAVHYAHERLVLHRDLKPANILMDEDGRPHLSDFSVARRVDLAGPLHTGSIAGTLYYMAPEQAAGAEASVTTSVDVYALGAILYELLTGRCPRRMESLQALVRSFEAEPVVLPRRLAPGVSRELEAVCLRALAVDPQERYRSATGLAADLHRLLEGGWPPWLAMTAGERASRWVRQHRWAAGSIVAGIALLVAVNASSYARVRAEEAELQEVVLRTNAALAKAQAQAALAVLERFATTVVRSAAEPHVEFFLERPVNPDRVPDPELLVPGFDSIFVIGCDGLARAHSVPDAVRRKIHPPPGYFRTNFSFRDYFRGANVLGHRGARQAYVSAAFHSRWDHRFKFAFATPIYRTKAAVVPCLPGTELIGVLVAARNVSSSLEQLQIADLGDSGHFTALYGPRDRDSPDEPVPDRSIFHVIVHDRLRSGDERPMDRGLSERLVRRFGVAAEPGAQFESVEVTPHQDVRYADPLWPADTRLLGGFYPVGRTGFVVGVQTPHGKATRPAARGRELLLLNLGFAAFLIAAVWASLRR